MMARFWRKLQQRLDAATPRERAGLAAMGAVAALALSAAAFDWTLRARQHEHETRAQRAEAQASLARESDQAFQETIAEDANKVWRWSIVESSEGLTRAQAAALAEALAAQAGLADVEVFADEAQSGAGALGAITLRINADFELARFIDLLQALENSETSFAVRAIEVTPGGDGEARLSLTLGAPFLLDAPQ